jgi:hypothetical protein
MEAPQYRAIHRNHFPSSEIFSIGSEFGIGANI